MRVTEGLTFGSELCVLMPSVALLFAPSWLLPDAEWGLWLDIVHTPQERSRVSSTARASGCRRLLISENNRTMNQNDHRGSYFRTSCFSHTVGIMKCCEFVICSPFCNIFRGFLARAFLSQFRFSRLDRSVLYHELAFLCFWDFTHTCKESLAQETRKKSGVPEAKEWFRTPGAQLLA